MEEKCYLDCYYKVGGTCKFYDWEPSEEHMECSDAEMTSSDLSDEDEV